jgi:AraC-like DNA-binding protein
MSHRPPQKWQATARDAISSVVEALRVRGRVYCRAEMTAPWGIAFPKGDVVHFHVVEKGPCWLRADGVADAVRLGSGDLVVLPHGHGHVLGDTAGSRALAIDHLLGHPRSGHGYATVRDGGKGLETRLVCGQFSFEHAIQHPLVSQLPALMHITGTEGVAKPWLGATLEFLSDETRRPRPGTATIVSRLTEIIFVKALRSWMDARPRDRSTWLGAMRDRRIGEALARIHDAPHRPWTIASLAAEAGMSRSPFAARFKEVVGEPPLAYLTRWRMLSASNWLLTSDVTVGQVGERAGYRSEAAFSKAFKRQFGLSPGHYRQRRLE